MVRATASAQPRTCLSPIRISQASRRHKRVYLIANSPRRTKTPERNRLASNQVLSRTSLQRKGTKDDPHMMLPSRSTALSSLQVTAFQIGELVATRRTLGSRLEAPSGAKTEAHLATTSRTFIRTPLYSSRLAVRMTMWGWGALTSSIKAL